MTSQEFTAWAEARRTQQEAPAMKRHHRELPATHAPRLNGQISTERLNLSLDIFMSRLELAANFQEVL